MKNSDLIKNFLEYFKLEKEIEKDVFLNIEYKINKYNNINFRLFFITFFFIFFACYLLIINSSFVPHEYYNYTESTFIAVLFIFSLLLFIIDINKKTKYKEEHEKNIKIIKNKEAISKRMLEIEQIMSEKKYLFDLYYILQSKHKYEFDTNWNTYEKPHYEFLSYSNLFSRTLGIENKFNNSELIEKKIISLQE